MNYCISSLILYVLFPCPGFNPVWNQSFSLVVHAPDYTYIRFKVMDEDWGPNADDFIGQFSASLESIMPGM